MEEGEREGEVREWEVVRGVSADGSVEWEDKWWRTWGPWGFKEMGAEKSGRDAYGSVWRESWREAMWQVRGEASKEAAWQVTRKGGEKKVRREML